MVSRILTILKCATKKLVFQKPGSLISGNEYNPFTKKESVFDIRATDKKLLVTKCIKIESFGGIIITIVIIATIIKTAEYKNLMSLRAGYSFSNRMNSGIEIRRENK
jgi:hypothetical protein